jgi:hypothetical protein
VLPVCQAGAVHDDGLRSRVRKFESCRGPGAGGRGPGALPGGAGAPCRGAFWGRLCCGRLLGGACWARTSPPGLMAGGLRRCWTSRIDHIQPVPPDAASVAVPGTYAERPDEHRPWSAPAKSTLHRPEPALIVAVDAVRLGPQQDLHRVPGPIGDLRGRGPGVQPPGDARVTAVVGPAGQRRGLLRFGERLRVRRSEHGPLGGRQVDAAARGVWNRRPCGAVPY